MRIHLMNMFAKKMVIHRNIRSTKSDISIQASLFLGSACANHNSLKIQNSHNNATVSSHARPHYLQTHRSMQEIFSNQQPRQKHFGSLDLNENSNKCLSKRHLFQNRNEYWYHQQKNSFAKT